MEFWDRKKYVKKNPYMTKENCEFCKLLKEDEVLILKETEYWEIRYNKYPYYWFKQNLMAFPKRHISLTIELNKEEILDFINVEKYMKNYFWEKNYFSFIRQTTWWRSIEHLHYHYLEWVIAHRKTESDNKNFKILKVS